MERQKIPCVVMRGGTSKAVFFREEDLPADEKERDAVILRIFGSPDRRQIDGLGGANSSTSKTAIIKKSAVPGFDVDYTFGQVSLTAPMIAKNGNCGNISSAVGPYAIDEGLVEAVEPVTKVRIWNTNTNRGMTEWVPVKDGRVQYEGDFEIHGVPGTASKIIVSFDEPGGAVTGRLLPSGWATDVLNIDGRQYHVSLVDGVNPYIYCLAGEIGVNPAVLPWDFEALPNYKEADRILEKIRCWGAVRCGFAATEEEASAKSPMTPKVIFVSEPVTYVDAAGREIRAEDYDLCARAISMGKMIHAYMGFGALGTITAANTVGTILHAITGKEGKAVETLRIGHPFGVMNAYAEVADGEVKKASIERTARRIMEGCAFL